MKLSRTQLAEILVARLPKARGSKQFAGEVAAYLLAEGRTRELDSLMRDMRQDEADQGRVEATAVSAYPLSAASQAEAEAALKRAFPAAKQIVITERIDPDIIGGIRLELANQQLDLSIRAKLNRFKQLTTMES